MFSPDCPDVSEAFRGKSVLVTGVTGFVGKVLLEKLLRCCSGVDRIYVIVRPKRGDGVKERIKELLSMTFFDRCRAECGGISWRCGAQEESGAEEKEGPLVIGVAGDVSQLGLGLSLEDKVALESRVSVVFHVAATVRFNDSLRPAVLLNTRGTREMLALARCMEHLEAFVHVSTAYAHVSNNSGQMEERFYAVPIEPEEMIKAAEVMDDGEFQEIDDKQSKIYRNTYLCTKALAERIIEKDYIELPVSIFRPGIVLSTHREPLAGWSEGFQGPSVCIVGLATGMVGTLLCDGCVKPELVPVDHVVNAMLTVAWARMVDGGQSEEVPIYNFVSSKISQITWNDMREVITQVFHEIPEFCKDVHFTRSTSFYDGSALLRQYLARTLDYVQGLRGKTSKVASTQQKIKSGIDSLVYFMTNGFDFSDVNSRALSKRASTQGFHKDSFDFDISRIDWNDYLRSYVEYLASNMLPQDIRETRSASERIQAFRLLYRSARVSAAIVSCAALYLAGILTHALYRYYVTSPSANT